jgi:geranylgeranyl diphosphate synthase type I
MTLDELIRTYQPAIETEIKNKIDRVSDNDFRELHYMMAYQLGWEGEGAGPSATGKRIRPLLVLLSTQASGGNWKDALPGAAAVELIHNFSLIHDDIEDNSPLRRGRPTLWVKWGIPLSINAGDAMFTLAHLSLLDLMKKSNSDTTLQVIEVLQKSCFLLTQGQHLDISYEDEKVLPIESYWPMVRGKTAALISACTEIGSLVAGVDEGTRDSYRKFGRDLGLAFQVLDDILGIWGDAVKIGKSNESDLVTGKKSLPVLFGLSQQGEFANRWLEGSIQPDEVQEVAIQLESEGARAYAQSEADRLTEGALIALEKTNPQGRAGEALKLLAYQLLNREI